MSNALLLRARSAVVAIAITSLTITVTGLGADQASAAGHRHAGEGRAQKLKDRRSKKPRVHRPAKIVKAPSAGTSASPGPSTVGESLPVSVPSPAAGHPTPPTPTSPAPAPAAPTPAPPTEALPTEPPVEAPPVTVPPVEAPNSSGKVLFSGSKISDFWLNQSAPGAVREVPNPTNASETVMKMTVADNDVAPVTPTVNPRAQLLSPSIITPGMDFWWHASFYLPPDFPTFVPNWLAVLEGPYGAPWAGTPPFSIAIDGDEFRWQRNGNYKWDIPWHAPLVRGQWTDVLVHTVFSREGSVELWINGEQITFFQDSWMNPLHEAPTTHLSMQTLDSSNDGGNNFIVLQNYRKVGMFNSVSVLQGPTKLGTTRASVEG